MSPLLQGQMDYIFFFYGLAFIVLGLVSYCLAREVNQRLPWMWLALFGFTHGLNGWMGLAALAWPDRVWFEALGWALMTVSFLFLVEFGRLSLSQRRGRGPGRWVLAILALGAGLGALSGWGGLNATTHYALGLVGSLGAGWALFAEGRQADPRCRPWLLAGGVGFFLYGLAAGVIVPRAGFFPAARLNYDSFTGLTGLPIQLVWGLLAVWITGMTVGYFQASWPGTSERRHQYRVHYLYGVGAALALILVFGWFFTQFMGNLAWQHLQQDSLAHNKLAIQRLAFEVNITEEAVMAMSGSPEILPVLESRSPQNLARANAVLDRYRKHFGASVAYLLDAAGVAIASSNRNTPDSFVGHQYAFRPYFQAAKAGKMGRYFALGVTSKKRGFYATNPVQDPSGKIIGVAVLKITLDRFQQTLRDFDPAFLIDPQGIVFVASRLQLDYQSLWPVAAADPVGFKARYGTDRFSPIFPQVISENDKVEFAGRRYVVTRQNIGEGIAAGWTLVNLEPLQFVAYYRLLGIAAAFILVVLTLVFAGSNLSIREGADRILASEARFRAMFDAAPEAVFLFDPETRKILDANPLMAQWLGYDPAELVNLEIDTVLEPEATGAREAAAGTDPGALAGMPSRHLRRQDGSLVDVELTAAQILHEDHIRELVFVRDITERKQAEAAIQKERDQAQQYLDIAAVMIIVLDNQGRIELINRKGCEILGYPEEEVRGREWVEIFIPEEDKDKVKTIFTDLLGGISEPWAYVENLVVTKSGQERLIAWHNTVLRDDRGAIVATLSSGEDITERKQGENELRQAKEYLENVLDNSADPIGIVDQNGKIIGWNKASVTILGYSLAEIEGKPFSEFYADDNELQEMLTHLRRDGLVSNYEIHLKKKDGAVTLFALSISLLFDRNQEVIGSVCVARDLSEIKKALDDLATANERLQQEVAERQRAEAELAWDARVNSSMVELSRVLLSSLPLEDISSLVYEHALSLTDSKLAFCGYLHPQTGALVVPTLTGEVWESCRIKDKKAEFSEFGGLWGWVLKHGQPLLTNNPSSDPRSTGAPPGHLPIHRFLAVPAIIGDELVGLIALANAHRDYTARDQEVCERLARLYALAIHRQRVNETLRESESGLQTILDNIQTGILIIDPENHVIVDANPEALTMIGVAKENIVGSVCHEFVCPAEPGRCPVTDLHEDVRNSERQMLRPDGTDFWVIQTVMPVTLHGKTHLLESFVDISERKCAEEALSKNYQELQDTMQRLEQSRNMLQLIIESVPVRVFWKDRDLRYLGCNTLFAHDAGFSQPQQLLGQDDYSMSWREQAEFYRTDDRQVMESRRPKLNIVEPQTTAAGAKVWVNTSKVPLPMPNGEVFGVLGVYEDITVRRQAEEALQAANAKLQVLVDQVEARNRTMTLASEMADMLQSCQTSEEAYEAVSHFMPRFFPDDAGALYMLNNSRNLFEAVASWGQAAELSVAFAPDECWAVRRGRLHRVDNLQEALSCRHVAQPTTSGYLCVPLIAQGETLGVFHIQLGPQAEEQKTELAVAKDQLALAVAEDMALALANLKLRETLRSQAIRDPLTGLFNRRYMEETLERELNRVKRQEAPLGVIMMDLDQFKQYNDTYGHSAGDELLSALGGLVKSQIRGEDIACRYGGEEFLLILPGTPMEVTLERAEILRQAVKEIHLSYRSLKPITLSLGVAAYPDHGDTGLVIIQAADGALYRAKQAGRDRVMVAEAAGELGKAQPPAPSFSLQEVR